MVAGKVLHAQLSHVNGLLLLLLGGGGGATLPTTALVAATLAAAALALAAAAATALAAAFFLGASCCAEVDMRRARIVGWSRRCRWRGTGSRAVGRPPFHLERLLRRER